MKNNLKSPADLRDLQYAVDLMLEAGKRLVRAHENESATELWTLIHRVEESVRASAQVQS